MRPAEKSRLGLSDSANPFLLGALTAGEGAPADQSADLPAVLVVATDGETRGRVHQRLEEEFEIAVTYSLDAAVAELSKRRFALALVDLRCSTLTTEDIIESLRNADGEMGVLLLCAGKQVKVWGEQVWQLPFDAPDVVKLAQDQVNASLRRRGRQTGEREKDVRDAFNQRPRIARQNQIRRPTRRADLAGNRGACKAPAVVRYYETQSALHSRQPRTGER